jgi:hypothetical protein
MIVLANFVRIGRASSSYVMNALLHSRGTPSCSEHTPLLRISGSIGMTWPGK